VEETEKGFARFPPYLPILLSAEAVQMTEPQEDPPDALQRDQVEPSIKASASNSPSPITPFAALTLSSDKTTYRSATEGVYIQNTTANSSANRPRLNETSSPVQPSPEFEGPPIRRQVELDHDVEIRDESAREGLSESGEFPYSVSRLKLQFSLALLASHSSLPSTIPRTPFLTLSRHSSFEASEYEPRHSV